MKRLDLTGEVFGRLMVLNLDEIKNSKVHWKCLCECGNISSVATGHLRQGKTRSCGCLQIESVKLKNKNSARHGASNSSEYGAWKNAKYRCYKISSDFYEDYGGRGIIMESRWLEAKGRGFMNFMEDMGPSNGLTLERVDVNGDYCKENCIWADVSAQAFNKRRKKTNLSGRTGVYKKSSSNKWVASITKNYKRITVYYGYSFEEACTARTQAEIEYYGFSKE